MFQRKLGDNLLENVATKLPRFVLFWLKHYIFTSVTLKRQLGFTLMELLVAVSLMVLIMGIVAMIFHQSSRVYRESVDVWTIYNTASVACDYLANDLNGCLPLDHGQQRFTLGEDNPGEDNEKARDWISFRAVVSVGGKICPAEVQYKLVEDIDLSVRPDKGGSKETVITHRPLYTLRRIVKNFDGNVLATNDLCHYVLAFNIEYYDKTLGTYREISDLKGGDNFIWPIGDKDPVEESIHSGLRVSLRVVAGASELKERLFSTVIWIPMGK